MPTDTPTTGRSQNQTPAAATATSAPIQSENGLLVFRHSSRFAIFLPQGSSRRTERGVDQKERRIPDQANQPFLCRRQTIDSRPERQRFQGRRFQTREVLIVKDTEGETEGSKNTSARGTLLLHVFCLGSVRTKFSRVSVFRTQPFRLRLFVPL